MDELIKQVTVVSGSGDHRETKVVYDDKQEDYPTFPIDDIVSCVTVIRGRGSAREAKAIFKSPRWADRDDSWESFEQDVRRFLKADMIRAQEAYQRHVESAHDAGKTWWIDLPANLIRSFMDAEKKVRKEKREEDSKSAAKSEAKGD
jgi:hypothetical protein